VEEAMKDLIKQGFDQGISRRQLMSGLTALGISTVTATTMAQFLGAVRWAGPGGDAARVDV
jgi:hypothetical protein